MCTWYRLGLRVIKKGVIGFMYQRLFPLFIVKYLSTLMSLPFPAGIPSGEGAYFLNPPAGGKSDRSEQGDDLLSVYLRHSLIISIH